MSEHARTAEHARLAAVLGALRVQPSRELRAQRAGAHWQVLRGDDVALRMLFAEHYRAIGALDQAARFGIVEPGWVRPRELRALRRVLLREVAGGRPRELLGLGRRARVPFEVADLIEVPERAVAPGSGPARALATIASIGGALWFVVVLARAIVAVTQGVEVLDALRAVRVEAFVAGVVGLAGSVWLRRHPRPRGDWLRRLEVDAGRRAEALLPSLVPHAERHALLRGWLASSWEPDAEASVRRLLVLLARERRRPAEAGRWGIAVDGLTTSDERARFAATLRAGDEWMRELEVRTERKPGRLGADERDTLIRAGVTAEAIDRRWMTNADRLTEIEHERVAQVLDDLLASPTDALRHERAAIVRAATRAPHPEVRRLLAEHYRALGEHEQAGRWGVADDGWATEIEVRALRLDLLEQRPTHATRSYLGLARHDRLPKVVADLERTGEPPEHALAMVSGVIGIVGVLALVVGVLLLPVAGALALLGIEVPGWLWPTIGWCGVTVVVGGPAAVGAIVLGDHLEARAARRDPYARELRWRLPGLSDPAERRSLAIGALSSRLPRTRRTARRVLVEASRRLGRADDVARWGASVDGATTADQREALAAWLARRRDPVRTYVVRSHRESGPLGADERDVLRRAGVSVETMDAFDAEPARVDSVPERAPEPKPKRVSARRLAERDRAAALESVVELLAELSAAPTEALRQERRDLRHLRVIRDPEARRLLAEHYRALGASDQAARWGLAIPGWVRPQELRALRLEVLRRLLDGDVRSWLGLTADDDLPTAVAELVDDVPVRRGLGRLLHRIVRTLLVMVGVGGCLGAVGGLLVVPFGAILRAISGDPAASIGGFVASGAVFTLVAVVLGPGALWMLATLSDRDEHRDRRARAAHAFTLLSTLERRRERLVLLRAIVRSGDADDAHRARALLVEHARATRSPVEAGRWGASIDGATTADERAAFSATLAASDGMRAFERRTLRRQGPIGPDELDVLQRAGLSEDDPEIRD